MSPLVLGLISFNHSMDDELPLQGVDIDLLHRQHENRRKEIELKAHPQRPEPHLSGGLSTSQKKAQRAEKHNLDLQYIGSGEVQGEID